MIGQNHITSALANQIKNGAVSHAYLFAGPRGTGKTTCAKIFARAINCQNPQNGSPCKTCECCKALEADVNMDIVEMDAASNNRVDEIREIRDKIAYPPINGKFKVYIIDEVHMLTDSAFNALLKTLEEPPAHAVFVLATTEPHKLPQTILSRCMRFDFRLVSTLDLAHHIKSVCQKENITITDEACKAIASSAEGGVRDALSITDCVLAFRPNNITCDDVLEVVAANDHDVLVELASSVLEKDVGAAFEIVAKSYNQGKNLSSFARDVAECFRNLIICKNCKNPNEVLGFSDDVFKKYNSVAQNADAEDLLWCMRVFCSILAEMRYSLSPRVMIENAIVTATTNSKKN